MKTDQLNALSSTVIAFATIVGLMGGLYFNLRGTTPIRYILILEGLFAIAVACTIVWVVWHLREVN